ncbi:MAG: ribosome small subunit-dependent GTPase A [Balneolales bacterium]
MVSGKVIKSTGSWYKVALPDGEVAECRLRGKLRLDDKLATNPIAVGDEVELDLNDDKTGSIIRKKERRNQIIREATHGKKGQQVIAANVDLAFSIQSVRKPAYRTGFIDRFLVTCEANNVEPVILINKTDLANESDLNNLNELRSRYESIGYKFITSSIYDPVSIEFLRGVTKDKVSVFIGPSGSGKSTLLNTLDPELNLVTGKVSGSSGKGKHTTTFAELIRLSYGAWLIDTPGIREFGLVDIEPTELSLFFPEMRVMRQECRFYNCTHIHEPKCAIHEALEKKDIHESRYESYRRILKSL